MHLNPGKPGEPAPETYSSY